MKRRSKIRIGYVVPVHNVSFSEASETARHCEKLNFDSVWTYDHFFLDSKPILECFAFLTSIAEETRRVNIGSLVISNLKRHPSLLAKMITSVSMISKGRFAFGIGSGGRSEEHVAYGIPFPNVDERFRRLEETVKLLKHLINCQQGDFEGNFYHIGETSYKRNISENWPVPIIVGGGGHRNISIAALWGDGWNLFNPSIEYFSRQHQEFKRYCINHGRNGRTKHVSVAVTCIIERDSQRARSKFKQMYPPNKPHESYLLPRYVGSMNDLAKFLLSYAAIGAEELIIDLPDAHRLDLIENLGERILPLVRHQ